MGFSTGEAHTAAKPLSHRDGPGALWAAVGVRAGAGDTNASPPPTPKRTKGPRPKHVPQRMCVACREHDTKRGLYRIVRTPEGTVEPDPTGRRNGRGAYLCAKTACWERALSSGLLNRALNVEIDQESVDALRRYAATLPLETTEAAGTAHTPKGGEA
jgi:predicted RNA-binding protein YlxR (DUF448 family)